MALLALERCDSRIPFQSRTMKHHSTARKTAAGLTDDEAARGSLWRTVQLTPRRSEHGNTFCAT